MTSPKNPVATSQYFRIPEQSLICKFLLFLLIKAHSVLKKLFMDLPANA